MCGIEDFLATLQTESLQSWMISANKVKDFELKLSLDPFIRQLDRECAQMNAVG